MRRILFLVLCVTCFLLSKAQIVWSGKTKVFIGDSNTEGVYHTSTPSGYDSYGANRFSSLLSSMKGSIEDNNGVSGMVMQDAVSGCNTTKASESLIPAKTAEHLFLYIMLGSNDIAYHNGNFNAAAFQAKYDQLVLHAFSKGWSSNNIILISPPWKPVGSLTEPANAAITGAYDVFYDYCGVTNRVDEARQQAYVNAVQAVALARGVVFIDLYTAMKNHPDRSSFLSEANGGYDRMHLSIAGHQFLANMLANSTYPDAAALPLSLIDFSALKNNNAAHLQWVSENEVNTKEFIIERSENGQPFQSIGQVKASGNTSSQRRYEFTDNHPFAGTNQYRLKMVDLDGRFEYSKTAVVTVRNEAFYKVTPNPARSYIEVRKSTQEPATLHIVDITGKTMLVQSFAGRLLKLDISKLQSGSYLISVKGRKESNTQKLIIQ